MTNRIDRLEEAGLVRRLNDPGDRRRVLVQLSKRGLKLIEGATEARFEAATHALQGLRPEQRQALSSLLREVLTAQA
jgi:DNA-binding MarR family transcriptional regulator